MTTVTEPQGDDQPPQNRMLDSNVKDLSSGRPKITPLENRVTTIQNDGNKMTFHDKDQNPDKATPSVVRTRQFRNVFPVNSPSDALMSPCTQLLLGKGVRPVPAAGTHHPTAILREKDQLPKFWDRMEDQAMDVEEDGNNVQK